MSESRQYSGIWNYTDMASMEDAIKKVIDLAYRQFTDSQSIELIHRSAGVKSLQDPYGNNGVIGVRFKSIAGQVAEPEMYEDSPLTPGMRGFM